MRDTKPEPTRPDAPTRGEKPFVACEPADAPAGLAAENRALKAELERYRLAVLVTREGLWDWDIPSGIIWNSWRTHEMLGLGDSGPESPFGQKIKNDDWMSAVHPEDYDRVAAAVQNHLHNNAPYDLEYRFRQPDGEYRWMRTTGKAIRDADGVPTRMLGALSDITEHKSGEEVRRRSEAYFRTLFDSTTIGVTITRADGSYVLTNGAYQRLVGYSAAELQQLGWPDISHPGEVERIKSDIQAMVNGEKHDITFEKQFLHKSGGIVWARLTTFLIGDVEGKVPLRGAIVEDITERKLAELALRDSQAESESARAYLTGALESMDNGFAIFDADERLVMCNEQFRALAPEAAHLYTPGAQFESVIRGGAELGQWKLSEDGVAALVENRLAEFRSGGRHEMPRADGTWLEAFDHKTDDGLTICYRIDITERKKAEEALRRSEANLNEAQKIGRLGSWHWMVGDNDVLWSDSLKEMYGLAAEQNIEGREGFLKFLHPDDVERVRTSISQAVENDAVYEETYRIIRADGEGRVLRGRGAVFRDDAGQAVRLAGITVDVTEQIEAERALRDSELRLREAQHISNIGDWESVGATADRRWSDEIYRILGRERDDYESTYDSFMACVHPDDRERIAMEIRKGMALGKPFSFEHRIVRPDGSVRYVLQRAISRLSDGGELGRAGTIQDITERKAMEEQLQQAQKMEAVGQLTGGIAHDFNNLLAVIMGNLELISSQIDAEEAVFEMIERGISATERGADLTHRLLAFSRRQTLMPVAVDLNFLVSDMIEMLRRTLGETIKIFTSEPADLWLCEADRSQLENALLNLAINARDAMPNGGKLVIETANILFGPEQAVSVPDIVPGPYVMLAVSDTGSGIGEDALEHVFEPFFTTKEVGKGSGLGLSMVYGFARQSDGNVTIESEEGKGTTVKLYLPRAQDVESERRHLPAKDNIPLGSGEHILVVEDDADVRDQAVNLLVALGYETSDAATAEAAIALVTDAQPFDLLLSDVILPDLRGPALAERVKRRVPDIAVVYMTGYAEGAFEHHDGKDKLTRLINKPFSKAELGRVIHDALRFN
ncbi:MAG: PAS domain-containing protein [Rhodospirillaceae bacterium]|nr:PAS domain-containing protein [Rhodospirillaceae bacterium]